MYQPFLGSIGLGWGFGDYVTPGRMDSLDQDCMKPEGMNSFCYRLQYSFEWVIYRNGSSKKGNIRVTSQGRVLTKCIQTRNKLRHSILLLSRPHDRYNYQPYNMETPTLCFSIRPLTTTTLQTIWISQPLNPIYAQPAPQPTASAAPAPPRSTSSTQPARSDESPTSKC